MRVSFEISSLWFSLDLENLIFKQSNTNKQTTISRNYFKLCFGKRKWKNKVQDYSVEKRVPFSTNEDLCIKLHLVKVEKNEVGRARDSVASSHSFYNAKGSLWKRGPKYCKNKKRRKYTVKFCVLDLSRSYNYEGSSTWLPQQNPN